MQSCRLGVDGQDPAEKNYTETESVLLGMVFIIEYTHVLLSLYIGPLRLYMAITLGDVPVTVLYPLLANEVYLPECHESDVLLVAVVCLRFNIIDSAPQLTVAGSANNTIAWSNTPYSAIGNFQTFLTHGTFSCSTTEGHVVSTLIARGEFE